MYPQTRVFDPSQLFSGAVPLPTETPYILFDLSGSDASVTADDLKYSVEVDLIVELWTAVHVLTLIPPAGWTTPAGLNANFELPGVRAGAGTWRVLYDFPKKLITLLSFTGAASPPGAGIPEPQTTGAGTFPVSAIEGPIVNFDESGGIVNFGGFEFLTGNLAVTLSKISTGTNGGKVLCPLGWHINGALNTDTLLVGSDSAVVGAWLVYTNIRTKQIWIRPSA